MRKWWRWRNRDKHNNNLIEAIELINGSGEIIKTQDKIVIRYIYTQGEILKIFKETGNFFENAAQIRSTIYFKIAVSKLLKKPWS